MENKRYFDIVPELDGQINVYIYKNKDFKGWHLHEFQEDNIYVINGNLNIYLIQEGKVITYHLTKGCSFKVPTNCWHGIQSKTIGTTVFYWYDKKFDIEDTKVLPMDTYKI